MGVYIANKVGKFYFQPYTGNMSFKMFLNIKAEERNLEAEKMLDILCCWGGMDKNDTLRDGQLLLGWEFANEMVPAAKQICKTYFVEHAPTEVWY